MDSTILLCLFTPNCWMLIKPTNFLCWPTTFRHWRMRLQFRRRRFWSTVSWHLSQHYWILCLCGSRRGACALSTGLWWWRPRRPLSWYYNFKVFFHTYLLITNELHQLYQLCIVTNCLLCFIRYWRVFLGQWWLLTYLHEYRGISQMPMSLGTLHWSG